MSASDDLIKTFLSAVRAHATQQAEAHVQYMELLRAAEEHKLSQAWAQQLLKIFAPHIGKMLSEAGCAVYRAHVDANYQTGEVQIVLNAQYCPPDKKKVN